MTIKRYKPYIEYYAQDDFWVDMEEREDGEWLKLSELWELLEKRKTYYKTQGWDALREEMEELLANLQDTPANFGSVTPKKLDKGETAGSSRARSEQVTK